MFFARGRNYATALEAALKAKEVALIHSEGILAGEMKHGPLALVSLQFSDTFLWPSNSAEVISWFQLVPPLVFNLLDRRTEGSLYPYVLLMAPPSWQVDENLPIIVVATKDGMHKKMDSVIQQLLARAAKLYIVCNEGDEGMKAYEQQGCQLIKVRGRLRGAP